jgi:2-phosphosulfolactate phosphatase
MNRRCEKRVIIDSFPESAGLHLGADAIVAVDVIRATTTAVTAAASGRRCFPASSMEHALAIASMLERPLLAGEQGGNMPMGFDLSNSPADLHPRKDIERPLVLLSTTGTRLLWNARNAAALFLASFRDYRSLARCLSSRFGTIAIIGAGSRGEFREEDQMCCAWIAELLILSGFSAADRETHDLVKRWSGKPPEACLVSKSVEYLRRTGQIRDLEFILRHVGDLEAVFTLAGGEVIMHRMPERDRDNPADAREARPQGVPPGVVTQEVED